mmetsp:Transcript_6/g.20  ORF Transcript_6/g.20 Transcript_6/m.20 type:complete len:205 (+) Transcript_6:2366-2980(+)
MTWTATIPPPCLTALQVVPRRRGAPGAPPGGHLTPPQEVPHRQQKTCGRTPPHSPVSMPLLAPPPTDRGVQPPATAPQSQAFPGAPWRSGTRDRGVRWTPRGRPSVSSPGPPHPPAMRAEAQRGPVARRRRELGRVEMAASGCPETGPTSLAGPLSDAVCTESGGALGGREGLGGASLARRERQRGWIPACPWPLATPQAPRRP